MKIKICPLAVLIKDKTDKSTQGNCLKELCEFWVKSIAFDESITEGCLFRRILGELLAKGCQSVVK